MFKQFQCRKFFNQFIGEINNLENEDYSMGIGKIMGSVVRGAKTVLKYSFRLPNKTGFKEDIFRTSLCLGSLGYSTHVAINADKNGWKEKDVDKFTAGAAAALGMFFCPAAGLIGGLACYFGHPSRTIEKAVDYFSSPKKSEPKPENTEQTAEETSEEQPAETAQTETVTPTDIPETEAETEEAVTETGQEEPSKTEEPAPETKETTEAAGAGQTTPTEKAPASQENNDDLIYTVKKGDCVWNIAKARLIKKNPDKTPTNAQILDLTLKLIEHNKLKFEADNYHVKIFPDDKLKMIA